MQDYQKRVMEEKAELDYRLDKLRAFMNDEKFAALPVEDQDLLAMQASHMAGYSHVLSQRMAKFNSESTEQSQ